MGNGIVFLCGYGDKCIWCKLNSNKVCYGNKFDNRNDEFYIF